MTLAPVHRGYAYQDLFTASRLVDVLVGDASEVVVDRKLFAGDRFDDLTGVLRTLVGVLCGVASKSNGSTGRYRWSLRT